VAHHSVQHDIIRPHWFEAIPLTFRQVFYPTAIALPFYVAPQKKELDFCIALTMMAVVSHVFMSYAFASV
jgi:hypothetical protein